MTMLNPKPLTPYLDLPPRITKTRSWPRLSAAEVIPLRRNTNKAAHVVPTQSAGDGGGAAFWAY